jgi:hypothetical protein
MCIKLNANMKQINTLVAFAIIFIFSSNSSIKSQDWGYSQHIAAAKKAELRGLTIDSDTNLYVTAFHRSLALGTDLIGPHGVKNYPALFAGPNYGKQDILILKLKPNGDTLWSKRIYGSESDYPRQIELDNNDNPYITGIYNKSALTIQGTLLPIPQDSGYDIFLAQYTSAGADVFARRVAWGPLDDEVDRIAVDASNNIYMTGTFKDTLYFEGDTLTTPTTLDKYIFLAKFKANGDFIWAKSVPVTINGDFLDIVVQNYDEIYLSGFFSDTLIYDTDSIYSKGTAEDIVLVQIDSSGALQWYTTAGSIGLDDRANGLTTDAEGSVYITGYFSGTASFSGTNVVTAGGFDMFLAKYNNSGTLQWVSRNGDAGEDIAYGAKIRENLLQTTGAFAGTVTFNGKVLTTSSINDQNAGFFVYDIDGNPITAEQIYSNPITNVQTNRGEYIEYDLAGNTYIGGYFEADTLFVGNDTLLRTATTHDAFVAKYLNPFSTTFSTTTNVSCPGGNDGKLLVTKYFGTPPYIYQWSPNVITYTDSVATELTAGTYWVKVTDALGDTSRIYRTLTQPPAFILTVDSTNITCNGASDGTLSALATGGTGTIHYAWTSTGGNSTAGDLPNQSGLVPAKYNLTITDGNACTVNDSVTLTEPDVITFGPVRTVEESPYLSFNGKIFLNVKGGTPVYNYEWDSSGVVLAGEITDSLVNRTEGYYHVEVNDANSCVADTTILIPGETFRVKLITTADVSCYGFMNGSALARIVSGNKGATLAYAFTDTLSNPIVPVNDSIINNLDKGWYYVTATETDGDLRTAIDSLYISEPDTLIVGLTPDSVICFGNNTGLINLVKTGGTAPFTFDWSNGQTSQSISLLTAGWYDVVVTDNNGCTVIDSTEVLQNDSIAITITEIKPITCNGDADATLQANVTGGVPGYLYDWNPGVQDQYRAVNLAPGNYSVTITDNESCTNMASYEIIEPDVPVIANIDATDVTCYNSANGRIEVTMSGGTEPYTYVWTPANTNSNIIDNLAPASYTLAVTDAHGCDGGGDNISITQPTKIVIDLETVISNNIIVSASGGTAPLQYILDGTGTPQATGQFNDLVNGTYFVDVTDANTCGPVRSSDLVVNVSGIIEAALNNTYTVFPNPSNGMFKVDFGVLEGGEYSLEIYSVSGSKVHSEVFLALPGEEKSLNIDLSAKSKGIYIVKMNGITLNTKLILE